MNLAAATVPAPIARLLTADEVAAILGVSRAHVYAKAWVIGCVRFGRVIRFRPEDLERYINTHAQSTADAIGKINVHEL